MVAGWALVLDQQPVPDALIVIFVSAWQYRIPFCSCQLIQANRTDLFFFGGSQDG